MWISRNILFTTVELGSKIVNEHERLSNITPRHKLTQRNSVYIAVLYWTFTVGSSTVRITHTLNGCETVPSLELINTLYFCRYRNSPVLHFIVTIAIMSEAAPSLLSLPLRVKAKSPHLWCFLYVLFCSIYFNSTIYFFLRRQICPFFWC